MGTSRAYAAYALGLLTLINLLNYTDRNVVFALFEPIKRELVLSDQQLGWLGSAYVIVLSLAALPLGVVGDLKSRRAVIAFGVGLWSAFTALGATVSRFSQLLVCRSLVGVGEAGYGPAAQALLAEFFQGKRRAFALGIYSVGMAFGGVLGIWLGGVLAERYGWRAAFVALGVPGFLLALLASRLREPRRQAPPTIRATVKTWYARGRVGAHEALRLGAPLIGLTLAGAALSAVLDVFEGLPRGLDTAVFAACVSIGIVWTVLRLVPVAVRGTNEATEVAATAFGDFLQAAGTVLRTPTLIWMFVGGALVTFAVNGLIAWAPSFLERTHGLGGPVCAALLLIDELRLFVPLLFGTFFLYSWYNGPLSAVILDVVPAAVRASVLGAYVLFSHLAGDAIAPPLIGYLSDRFGLRPAMLLLPTAGAVGGLVILISLSTVGRDMARVKT